MSYIASGEVLSYREMCDIEKTNTLQRGMNYRMRGHRTIVLMSRRSNAPYRDRVEENGKVLWYEGHDEPLVRGGPDPKSLDQPAKTRSGRPTQNGLFAKAASDRGGTTSAERVQVYEKLKDGIWVYNGEFLLQEVKRVSDGKRFVFNFRLDLAEFSQNDEGLADLSVNRMIPSNVKIEVWKRDGGRCCQCGAADNLHFDHVVPFSKGGSSLVAENIQLLCARHNLAKRDRIQ